MFTLSVVIALQCSLAGGCDYTQPITLQFPTINECKVTEQTILAQGYSRYNIVLLDCIEIKDK